MADVNTSSNEVVEVAEQVQKTNVKNEKIKKNKKPKKDNPNSFGKKCKAIFSELKKVTWPTPKKTIQQTCVVLVFCLVFIVVLLGLNSLFGFLANLLLNI